MIQGFDDVALVTLVVVHHLFYLLTRVGVGLEVLETVEVVLMKVQLRKVEDLVGRKVVVALLAGEEAFSAVA